MDAVRWAGKTGEARRNTEIDEDAAEEETVNFCSVFLILSSISLGYDFLIHDLSHF